MLTDEIKWIGIVGGGKIGTELFNHFSGNNYKIVWYCRSNYNEKLKKWHRRLERKRKNNLISPTDYDLQKQSIITNSIYELKPCNIIFEAIYENLDKKNILINEISAITNNKAIIASTSSSIHPGFFNVSGNQSQQILGTHVFYPMQIHKVVEIIPGEKTSDLSLELVKNIFIKSEFKILVQNKSNCFLINRFLLDLQSEMFQYCVKNHISLKIVEDKLLQENLIDLAIFTMIDSVGHEIMLTSIKNYIQLSPDNEDLYTSFLNFIQELDENHVSSIFNYPVSQDIHLNAKIDGNSIIEYFKKKYVLSLQNYVKKGFIKKDLFNQALTEVLGINKDLQN